MSLALLVAVPLVFGLVGWGVGRRAIAWSRWFALAANAVNLLIVTILWAGAAGAFPMGTAAPQWLAQVRWPWIPVLGISFSLSLDGLSLALLALTAFLGIASVLASWTGIKEKVGFFHFNLSLVLAGVNGVFLATDLFLFAFFWELMLIPMYFLIDLWGHENRHKAAVKFFTRDNS